MPSLTNCFSQFLFLLFIFFNVNYFTIDKLESYGNANLLKGGIVYADHITTVSETYAKEIQSTEGGEGLDGLMRAKSFALSGISYYE